MSPSQARLLLILDGWGEREEVGRQRHRPGPPAELARAAGRLPAHAVHTEGRHVGLPDGQMGNSEVGHMNIGAGRHRLPGPDPASTPRSRTAASAQRRAAGGLRGGLARRRHAAPDGPALAGRRAQPREAPAGDVGAGGEAGRAAGRRCTPSSTAATRRRAPRGEHRAARGGLRRRRQRFIASARRALLRDGPRQALGARAPGLPGDHRGAAERVERARRRARRPPTRAARTTSSSRRPWLGAWRARGRRRRGGVHEFPRRRAREADFRASCCRSSTASSARARWR
jgi:hypothetical protein